MSDHASIDEFEAARLHISRAAHAADREIRRRSMSADSSEFEVEAWLLFAVQHGALVGEPIRSDAESLLIATYGWPLWCELRTISTWRTIADLHQEALVILLDRMRSGSDDPCTLRRRRIREAAFGAAWWNRTGMDIDEWQGR